jgi:hypothetical protein
MQALVNLGYECWATAEEMDRKFPWSSSPAIGLTEEGRIDTFGGAGNATLEELLVEPAPAIKAPQIGGSYYPDVTNGGFKVGCVEVTWEEWDKVVDWAKEVRSPAVKTMNEVFDCSLDIMLLCGWYAAMTGGTSSFCNNDNGQARWARVGKELAEDNYILGGVGMRVVVDGDGGAHISYAESSRQGRKEIKSLREFIELIESKAAAGPEVMGWKVSVAKPGNGILLAGKGSLSWADFDLLAGWAEAVRPGEKKLALDGSGLPFLKNGEEWHNPQLLTSDQIEVRDGWRPLLVSEVNDLGKRLPGDLEYPIYDRYTKRVEAWYPSSSRGLIRQGVFNLGSTYRTKAPVPAEALKYPIKG